MQLYDITIAANTTRQLDAPGSYFYYYAGSAGGADSTITLRGLSSGLRLILKPGQAFRLPKGQKETAWVMTNYANTATIIGSVLVGDGDVTDNRITGSVEVIDGGKNRTMAKTAFVANSYSPGSAGTYAHNQLWNPIGSGKNIIVESIINQALTASAIQIGERTAAISTLNASQPKTKFLSSGVASVAQLRTEANAALLQTTFAEMYLPASTSIEKQFKEPIVIPPGVGLICVNTSQPTALVTVFEFFEEAI